MIKVKIESAFSAPQRLQGVNMYPQDKIISLTTFLQRYKYQSKVCYKPNSKI